MTPFSTTAIMVAALLLGTSSCAYGQEGTYDLWFCLERCDASNREGLAVTRAALVLESTVLDLGLLAPAQSEWLDLVGPENRTDANGCMVTHIDEGDVFDPEIDWFSLVAWRPTSETTITVEAPQDPPGYTLALWFDEGLSGVGRSRHHALFISGEVRATEGDLRCPALASLYKKR